MGYFTTESLARVEDHILTILNGQTESDNIDLRTKVLVALEVPSAFTGTAITLKVSYDEGQTFSDLFNTDNVAIGWNVINNRTYALQPIDTTYFGILKIVSNASETGDRRIKVIFRTIS